MHIRDDIILDTWSKEAVNGIIENYVFLHAWSNWLLELILVILFILSMRLDVKQRKVSSMSLGFLALLAINGASAIAHGIERIPSFNMLANDITYINFSLLGFASLFFEFFVLERLKTLKSKGFDSLDNFPFKYVSLVIVLIFVAFQMFNWFARKQPKFLYAVIDYSASLIMMSMISVYVMILFRSKRISELNNGSDIEFDKRFELYSLLSVLIVVLATYALGARFVRRTLNILQYPLPDTLEYPIFTPIDVYHILLIPSFILLFKARLHKSNVYFIKQAP